MGYARTVPTVYTVNWPQDRIVKVGYSAQTRWRAFQIRGANLLGLMEFQTGGDALDFEYACQMGLKTVCRAAFNAAADAINYLGNGGGGYLECYLLPGDLMQSEVLAFIDSRLAAVHAGTAG